MVDFIYIEILNIPLPRIPAKFIGAIRLTGSNKMVQCSVPKAESSALEALAYDKIQNWYGKITQNWIFT